jgi:hypothetical protein
VNCTKMRLQGCQMAYFRTKNPNLGKFLKDLRWSVLVCFMAIWYILWPLSTFYGNLVYFSRFGMLYQEISGNPVHCWFFLHFWGTMSLLFCLKMSHIVLQ